MKILSALLSFVIVTALILLATPVLTAGLALVVVFGCFFIWLLPILLILGSDQTSGGATIRETGTEASGGPLRGIRHCGARDNHHENLLIFGRSPSYLYGKEESRAGLRLPPKHGLTYDPCQSNYRKV